MKQAVSSIARHIRVYKKILTLCIQTRMVGRPITFIITALLVALEIGIMAAFAHIMFQNIPNFYGYSREQLFITFGTAFIIEALGWLTIRSGADTVSRSIRNGKIDATLTQPLNSLFLILFRRSDPEDVSRIILALTLIIPAHTAFEHPLSLHIVLYLIAIFFAWVIYAGFLGIITSFHAYTGEAAYAIIEKTQEISRYPYTIFTGPTRWIFLTLLPTACFGTLPTLILTTPNPWKYLAFLIVWAIVMVAIAHFMWNRAMKFYESASG